MGRHFKGAKIKCLFGTRTLKQGNHDYTAPNSGSLLYCFTSFKLVPQISSCLWSFGQLFRSFGSFLSYPGT